MYNHNQHVHFIGIGGVGMAGIAEVLLNLGYRISGSDLKKGALVEHLENLGVSVFIGHHANNISEDTTVVVVSSAVLADNCELIEARRRNITVIPRAEMLGEIMRMKYGICVAGSHGKTTTTSMVSKILSDAGLDPTVIIGGRILSQRSGARVGAGDYVVAEADESDGSFKLLKPAISVVTNIDNEHLGHYGSFGALEDAFLKFMEQIPFYGVVVACCDDPVVARLVDRIQKRVIRYGSSDNFDLWAKDIRINQNTTTFTLGGYGKEFGEVVIPVPGAHMVQNALAAIGVGIELGVFIEEAVQSLNRFEGVARRSELIGKVNGIHVFDDYGHHPTEISATLAAMRAGWLSGSSASACDNQQIAGRLIVVFQPHRYSRTKELFSEFLTAFNNADIVFVSDIYAAGETAIAGISAEKLAKALDHNNVIYLPDLPAITRSICDIVSSGDIVVTVGAGNVNTVAYEVVRVLTGTDKDVNS